MKIGLDISVLNVEKTGIGFYVDGLITKLLDSNKKNEFILFGVVSFKGFNLLKKYQKYPNVKFRIIKIPTNALRRFILYWQKIGWPKIEMLTKDIDIFHSFNWYLPPQKKGKVVATIFDLTPIIYPEFHKEKTIQLERLRFKRVIKFADLVIAISEHTKKDFLKLSPNKRVEVIYPAVSKEFNPKKNSKDKKVLKKYNLKNGYILSVATLEPRKNVESLIKAYLKSSLKHPLVLVGGEGWKNEKLLKLVKKFPNRIKITGYILDNERPAFYRQALCLVYPSLYEGFGIPVLEAMSCGTPVITSNNSSLPEVGGDAVLYIDAKNIDQLAEKLEAVASSQTLRGDLKRKSIIQSEKFSWDRSIEKLLSVYSELLEE